MRRHLFIINPAAGKKDRSGELRAAIRELGLESFDVAVTSGPGDATRIVDEAARGFDGELWVFACGGDGTLCEVIEGARRHKNVSVGSVPIGSGNDFIKSFDGLNKESFIDLKKMIEGDSEEIDMLTVNDKASVNIVSVGYDAAVAERMQKYKKLPLISGSMAYKISVFYCLIKKTKHKFKLFVDGLEVKESFKTFLLAIAANGKYYGGGFKAAPYSDFKDGLIDLIYIPTVPRRSFIFMLSSFRKGKHIEKFDFIRFLRCKTLQVVAEEEIPVNLDGEIYLMKDPLITVKEKAIKIIVPKIRSEADKEKGKAAAR